MIKFVLKKIGRDMSVEHFKAAGISPTYRILTGNELRDALKAKLVEEASEVQNAQDIQEIIAELADLQEVIYGLCNAYSISISDVHRIREESSRNRGGFQMGLYIESIEMDETNPRVTHFRASPEKYPEI